MSILAHLVSRCDEHRKMGTLNKVDPFVSCKPASYVFRTDVHFAPDVSACIKTFAPFFPDLVFAPVCVRSVHLFVFSSDCKVGLCWTREVREMKNYASSPDCEDQPQEAVSSCEG